MPGLNRLRFCPNSFRQSPKEFAVGWFSENVNTAATPDTHTGRSVNLVLATWVSAINFWAWNMIGPLSTTYAGDLSLSSTEASMLVATPILVGSLGRIVIGSLTDRFGGRTMFIAVSLASIIPVLAVGAAGAAGSYPLLLVCGFFLGIAGTIFAVGIPFANSWYEASPPWLRDRRVRHGNGRHRAFGVLHAPVRALVRPVHHPRHHRGRARAHRGGLCVVVMRNSPDFTPNTGPVVPKLMAAAKLRVTWEMSFLYAVVFGGFVAFANYLPTYIKTIYGFSAVDAGARTAGFALAAVLARPVGGALSDRIPPKYVVLASFAGTAVMAFVAVFQPPPDVWSARDVHHAGDLPRHRHRRCVRVGGPPRTRDNPWVRSPESLPPQAVWAATSRRW